MGPGDERSPRADGVAILGWPPQSCGAGSAALPQDAAIDAAWGRPGRMGLHGLGERDSVGAYLVEAGWRYWLVGSWRAASRGVAHVGHSGALELASLAATWRCEP